MLWLFHRWLAFVVIKSYVFEDCKSLFLRHTATGRCITVSDEDGNETEANYSFSFMVVMTENCLHENAQFRFLDSQILHDIKNNGTLVNYPANHWTLYKGVSGQAKVYERNTDNHLKQTAAGSLFYYKTETSDVCVEPSSKYLSIKSYCNTTNQQFTFGSITAYNKKMRNTQCSSVQYMMAKSAQYGNFNRSGMFDPNPKIDTQCTQLANCQVKSLCEGKKSCRLTMDESLLPSEYCPDNSKQIYTKYTCVDTYRSSAMTKALNIRLTERNKGHIEIKNGSVWKKADEENWNDERQKMLCQHLGFETFDGITTETRKLISGQQIATGDLICYNSQPNGTSCCIHLEPSTSSTSTKIPYVNCKICDNPLLYNTRIFPDSVFSGSDNSSEEYKQARITKGGWCPSSNPDNAYLLLDLQKEYNIKGVVVMADHNQTKWSSSYSLEYGRDTSFKNGRQISGNQNGHQASRTKLDIYNVRYLKIKSTGNRTFCLRIELCVDDPDKQSEDDINIVAVIATVAAVFVCLVFVLAVVCFRRRKRNKQHGGNQTTSGSEERNENYDEEMDSFDNDDEEDVDTEPEDPVVCSDNNDNPNPNDYGNVLNKIPAPVAIAEFAHYVKDLKTGDNGRFQQQYDLLPKDVDKSWEVAKKPFNKEKNRYGNIVTFDYCRVVLSGDENEDYINASFIDGIKENSYIASQGPTKLTVDDMWRMVWEQGSCSIVMVTSLIELGKPKCEKYWPDDGTEKYGDIEVTLMNTAKFAYYVSHTLRLKKDDEEREIRHYYFQSWPDHGVPQYPTELLVFRRHFRKHHVEQSGPIVVHCSAGVGRTGVFLAIDMILDKLEKGVINSIDVFGEVCAMRERRMNMVQTLEQYIFIHKAILETILCGMNEVDSSNIREEIKLLNEVKASGKTGFQEKFKTLGEVSPELSPEECTAALLEGNMSKNRNKNIYPAERDRVSLEYVDGVQNSDYINAVYVNGYLGKNHFIATQSPLPSTVNDFWRLVHSQNSSVIVLLNNVKDGTSYPMFWPTKKGQPIQYGSFTVQLESQKETDGICTRELILSPYPDLSDGRVINIFHYTKWPKHRVPLNADGVITLTSLVEDSRKNHGNGPTIVACSDGAGRSGTYIAISNLLERVKVEQTIDVFQSIKIIRGARPQFVENAKQYQFCYTAVLAYLDGLSEYANIE